MRYSFILFGLVVLVLASCTAPLPDSDTPKTLDDYDVATFAGGCFWCIESAFEYREGVVEAVSGFSGGELVNPSYRQVISGTTGHVEAVQVYYDPEQVSYEELVEYFWQQFDPTDAGGSFVDRGPQYTSAIFYHDAEQMRIAQASKQALEDSGRFRNPIVTPIVEYMQFYAAEDYHQDYYKNNPTRYGVYRFNSGRDQFREQVWGDALVS